MSTIMSWLARVSLCVALVTPAMLAAPASAETKAATKASAQKVSTSDLACLSEALYFEARGEGHKGQQAVAEVILNRVDHPKFPKSVCGVVNQKGQFTYKKGRIREQGAFNRAKKIAQAALQGAPRNLTNGATYFHTGAVKPSWSRKFERTTRIGSHTFYRSDRRLASN
ncbi:cell wall hydrolase [Paracoccus ravus]|uniref:cell wall hydrolase n=1 Tax=Paracoccus ravus TaxID=2447760 RepID=UPI00106E17ED|nr:cell wall hydrolase [Paracoccus ravus]